MIVVSDTTAISNLIQINELNILTSLYQEVIIPPTVFDELLVLEDFDIPVKEKLSESWVRVQKVNVNIYNKLINKYGGRLDKGEAEAIALAKEISADYLLIDEKAGRVVARDIQLNIIGTIGILLDARKKGLINSIKNKMDDLRDIGFWISDGLYEEIIKLEQRLI
ncbi:DUF3368 domain-containing protein [Catalinimonas sp. 4WD22]|uniref:DUF3368 domain-containing protein n=1 Tax=Catalinimonas locisalis TaxID=3133978 RepID=UPI0031012796